MVSWFTKSVLFRQSASLLTCLLFILSAVINPVVASAQTVLNLPLPGSLILPTSNYVPAMLKGITIHPENPLQFDFIVNIGDTDLSDDALRNSSERFVKYFLAALTVPEKQLWVNLSPKEPNRIIPSALGDTLMGQDMLAQDYLLKQLTASLLSPNEKDGALFWESVYSQVSEKTGQTEIPTDLLSKIWIVPDHAKVYEHGATAYVMETRLKVLMEEDYLLNAKGDNPLKANGDHLSAVKYDVMSKIILPIIEKEINEGESFSQLRQIYNAMVLATWYKQRMKDSLLGKIFVDQNRTKGFDTDDKKITQKIYQQYMESFKVGVANYIKEEYDLQSQAIVSRKYFTGGEDLAQLSQTTQIVTELSAHEVRALQSSFKLNKNFALSVNLHETDAAMINVLSATSILTKYLFQESGFHKVMNKLRILKNLGEFNRKSFLVNASYFKVPSAYVTEEFLDAVDQFLPTPQQRDAEGDAYDFAASGELKSNIYKYILIHGSSLPDWFPLLDMINKTYFLWNKFSNKPEEERTGMYAADDLLKIIEITSQLKSLSKNEKEFLYEKIKDLVEAEKPVSLIKGFIEQSTKLSSTGQKNKIEHLFFRVFVYNELDAAMLNNHTNLFSEYVIQQINRINTSSNSQFSIFMDTQKGSSGEHLLVTIIDKTNNSSFTIMPDRGLTITDFTVKGKNVLYYGDDLDQLRGIFLLGPWVNRLDLEMAKARGFDIEALKKSDPVFSQIKIDSDGNANHGVLRDLPWKIANIKTIGPEGNQIEITGVVNFEDYPVLVAMFGPLKYEVTYVLRDNNLSVKYKADGPIGFHPCFNVDVKSTEAQLKAQKVYAIDVKKRPTHLISVREADLDFNKMRSVDPRFGSMETPVFTDIETEEADPDYYAVSMKDQSNGTLITMWVERAALPYFVLWNTDKTGKVLGAEPMSDPANFLYNFFQPVLPLVHRFEGSFSVTATVKADRALLGFGNGKKKADEEAAAEKRLKQKQIQDDQERFEKLFGSVEDVFSARQDKVTNSNEDQNGKSPYQIMKVTSIKDQRLQMDTNLAVKMITLKRVIAASNGYLIPVLVNEEKSGVVLLQGKDGPTTKQLINLLIRNQFPDFSFDLTGPLAQQSKNGNPLTIAIFLGQGVNEQWVSRLTGILKDYTSIPESKPAGKNGNGHENSGHGQVKEESLVGAQTQFGQMTEDGKISFGFNEKDAAMINPGGIDFDPSQMNLEIKRDANFVPLPLEEQPIETMHIEGFVPIIIDIKPIQNLPELLGFNPESQDSLAQNQQIPFTMRTWFAV